MFTPFTDSNTAIAGATALGLEKTWRPSRRWDLARALPVNQVITQVQQLKAATLIATTPASAGNQGQAKQISNLRITRTPINGGAQFRISVSFTPAAADPYFQGVAVSLQQSNGTPLQVAVGRTSPISFIANASGMSSSVIVQSIGSLSDTPAQNSPSRAISLRANQS